MTGGLDYYRRLTALESLQGKVWVTINSSMLVLGYVQFTDKLNEKGKAMMTLPGMLGRYDQSSNDED